MLAPAKVSVLPQHLYRHPVWARLLHRHSGSVLERRAVELVGSTVLVVVRREEADRVLEETVT